MKRKSEVHLFATSPHSGLLKAMLRDSSYLRGKGYSVSYFIPDFKEMKYGGTYEDNVNQLKRIGKVKRISIKARSNRDLVRDIFIFGKCLNGVDFLVSYGNYAGKISRVLYRLGFIKKLYHIPQCTEFERKSFLPRLLEMFWERMLRHQQSLIIACGPSERFSLTKEIGVCSEMVFLCPNSIETVDIPAKINKNSKEYKYIVVCRASKDKRIGLVLEAISLVGELPKAIIIGGGPELSKLKSLYPEAAFLGHQDVGEIVKKFKKVKYIVSASLVEGMSFSILEAMKEGVVPILSRVRGHKDIILEGHNGFLFESLEELSVILFKTELIGMQYYKTLSRESRETTKKLGEINSQKIAKIFP